MRLAVLHSRKKASAILPGTEARPTEGNTLRLITERVISGLSGCAGADGKLQKTPSANKFRLIMPPLRHQTGFHNWLFLLITGLRLMPLQDAGQLLPAVRSQLESFSLTEEDFPPLPPPLRRVPVLQWRCPDRSGSRLTRGGCSRPALVRAIGFSAKKGSFPE